MKTFLLLFVFATLGIQAQITHNLNWDTTVGSELNLTINVGDKVIWTWTDNSPHTVESKPGSAENFSSLILTGEGSSFEHTFVSIGTNPYVCGVHPSMGGTITVEQALSNEEFSIKSISLSPNPAKDFLTLNIPNSVNLKTVSIYNILGKEIINTSYLGNKINISNLTSGMYLLKLSTTDSNITKRFIKQ
ncbi:T9SS type A sorting domain-containing protein [Aestuariibaculum suncheonense]|uniref:T9SS type A sorting domain-containing protein n=1 Tax=Aestuariibaculum suncheonense TaxID=1028745 RepID=A0A8J6UG01_9FLAO|nr:T9SS type A sorting domain-containing protein [Aestuariibaculum suncheonense]MBD0834674.1 T9SS type A sorting domain-containing protein [Aestuariibaculum suncheonense]